MKLFSWMQNKNNGKGRIRKTNLPTPPDSSTHRSSKEEFSDWPNGLLAIGTFGNHNLIDQHESNLNGNGNCSQDDLSRFSQDEHVEADKNLKLILDKQMSLSSEKFFDCLSSIEDEIDDWVANELTSIDSGNEKARPPGTTSAAKVRGKDVRLDTTRSGAIGKKSLSFLVKKALVCTGGFPPPPVLKDPFLEPKLEKSRMEKIFRAIMRQKIYPQNPSPKPTAQKYLDMPESDTDEDEHEEASDGSKWVKTDSEYIVLEI